MSGTPSPVYRHRTLQDHAFAEGRQLPNRFFLGDNRVNSVTGVEEVSVWQEDQVDPAPTWWAVETFNKTFEKIPLVG